MISSAAIAVRVTTLSDTITAASRGRHPIVAVSGPTRSPFLQRCADAEGERRRSGRRRLVRHVAAGRRVVGIREKAERGRRRYCTRQVDIKEKLNARHVDSGRLDAEGTDKSARRRHRVLAADREGHGLQDHELRIVNLNPGRPMGHLSRMTALPGRKRTFGPCRFGTGLLWPTATSKG